MKIYTILFLSFLLAATSGMVTAENDLRERIYLQTDKQTYLAGELLWVKLYLTDADGIPNSFSKIGYIELVDETTAQVQVKVEITGGTGACCLELPATLPTGYYQLIAYTRQMKNEGENVFFNKTVSIINTFRADDNIKSDTLLETASPSLLENNIVVLTDKGNYKPRSKSHVQIKEIPENMHSLSISITGKDLITESFNINQWKKHLSSIPKHPVRTEFIPEYEGHIISGKIVNAATEAPISNNEKMNSFVGFIGDQIRLFNGKIGNNGDVQFITKRISGAKEISTSVLSSFENKYRVNIVSPFFAHTEKMLPTFTINPKWQDQLLQRSVGLQALYAYVADSLNLVDTTFAHFQWKPDRSYILDEYTRFTRMDEVIIEFIPSLRFRRIDNKRILSVLIDESASFAIGNSLVLLDGIPIFDHEIIFKYDPLLVYKIDVYKNRFDFGDQFFDGIVYFTTYKHDYPTLKVDEQTQVFDYEGTQVHRYFYTPSYLHEEKNKQRIPDYRHTLLWEPNIKIAGATDIQIPFVTSDLTGGFQVIVEGITKDGKIIYGSSFFNVTE